MVTVSNEQIWAELRRQGQILDELAGLLPAMRSAAGLLDNPAARWRARHRKET